MKEQEKEIELIRQRHMDLFRDHCKETMLYTRDEMNGFGDFCINKTIASNGWRPKSLSLINEWKNRGSQTKSFDI